MAQELKTRLYTIKINPITGLVDAPKKMFFYRTDAETSVLQVQSTEELPTGSVVSLTCIKKSTQSIVTMTSTVGADNKTFICGLLSQFTSTSDTLTCEVKITQETDKVTTFPSFTILVNPSIVDGVEGGVDPVEETTLSNLIAEVNDALSSVSEVVQGADGRGITSITKTGTNGLVDTYTITYTDATTSTFEVTNGKDGVDGVDGADGADGTNGTDGRGIVNITKTSTSGLVDTYTILYTDETTSTFTVTNGKDGSGGGGTGSDGRGITSITKTGTEGLVDTYTITYTDDTTSTFTVTNGTTGADGRGIVNVEKTGTSGLVDTYTITYTDETTSTFTITNGKDGADGSGGTGTGGTGNTLYNYSDFEDTAKYTGLGISKSSPNGTGYPLESSLTRRCFKVTLTDPLTAWQNYNDLFFAFGRLSNLYYNNNLSTSSLTNKYKGKLYARIEFNGVKGTVAEPTLETYTKDWDFEIIDFPKALFKKPYYNFVFELKLDKTNNIVQLWVHSMDCHTATVSFATDETSQTVEGGSTLLMSFKMNGSSAISMMIKSITLYFFNEAEDGTNVSAGQFDSTTTSYKVKFCGKIES